MAELRALIAAAGKGTRAGLPYPKTLFSIQGTPILVRLARLLDRYDPRPVVIVSPDGLAPIAECLADHAIEAELTVQDVPRGMGDAVLRFGATSACSKADHVVLVWGDVPFIQPETLDEMIAKHLAANNDFTFATRHVDSAYTVVARDAAGRVTGVVETREQGESAPQAGERDIGLFVFRPGPVMDLLGQDLPGKLGKSTGEHGFLYVIGHLAAQGFRVAALPIAREEDIVSLNSMSDIAAYL